MTVLKDQEPQKNSEINFEFQSPILITERHKFIFLKKV